MIQREMLIYQEQVKTNSNSYCFFTYGDNKNDDKLDNNVILFGKKYRMSNLLYMLFVPFIFRSQIKNCDILKTNQMDGALSAVIAKLLFKKKLYLRTGYSLYRFHLKRERSFLQTIKNKIIKKIESFCINNCDIFIVSSEHDAEFYIDKMGVPKEKVRTVKNYVSVPTDIKKYESRKDEFLFVGRLTKQKNLENLILAFNQLSIKLTIVGAGPDENYLKSISKDNIIFVGRKSQEELEEYYRNLKYYILPSFYEGMPKTLIEAMSNGMVCFGTDVEGINELIEGNGYVIDKTSKESILAAISRINKKDDAEFSVKCHDFIKQNHSIEVICKKENDIYNEIIR